MNMNKTRLTPAVLSALLLAALCAGCSVKEDRTACPCALILDFSEVGMDRADSLSLSVRSSDGFIYRDIVREDDYGTLYEVDIPKGETWINVFSVDPGRGGLTENLSEDWSTLSIPYGEECPEVSTFSMHATLMDETVTVPVDIHKNYCKMTISMLYEGPLPVQISLIGDVCGYDRDARPIEGDFLFEPTGTDGVFYAKIPRQVDTSLRLDLSDEEEVLREFAIGEYIEQSGYDWTAENLGDIVMQINYANSGISVTINDWSEKLEIETVI